MNSDTTTDPPRMQAGVNSTSGNGESASQAFQQAARRVAEIREYVAVYVAAQADTLKLAVRNTAIYAALGIIALLAAVAGVATAVVLLLLGAANGINQGLHSLWLGQLIVGFSVLALIAIGAIIGISSLARSSRKTTVEKYESRKRSQRFSFGKDIDQRSAPGSAARAAKQGNV